MARCNTQANDMATTANNWKTSGASVLGRYNSPPLTEDLVPRSQERNRRKQYEVNKSAREKMNKIESTRVEKRNDESDENQKLKYKIDSETTPVRTRQKMKDGMTFTMPPVELKQWNEKNG